MVNRNTNKLIVLICIIIIFRIDVQANIFGEIQTNQVSYSPSEEIQFKLEITELPIDNLIQVDYYYLNQIIG